MKSKGFLALIIMTFILTKNVDCQTVHLATGQNVVPKSGLAVENTKSIPFFLGVDYLQKERIYLTTNLGLLKRDYQVEDKDIVESFFQR